ncbi:hypothetical protein Bealeia2_02039 (plasmid) [Candidatus Bealeia paramacronuclearis]|uniref:hypothetical protein n=1 Tax=Candidatus Bealeia paramacronuclearis TaxID=1921001 RepID=UPI002B59B44C|nr:hypothetical protein [Candidatus Bealeia paramacronuclearis]
MGTTDPIGHQNLGLSWRPLTSCPLAQATGAFDTTLMQACLQFCIGTSRAFPMKDTAKIKTFKRSDAFLRIAQNALSQFLNWQLTSVDSDYYVDSRRMLFYLILLGSAFKKVYTDPLTQRPTARFIQPQHL